MKKILIVEDDLVFSRMLANWLEKKRLQVECTTSVATARKLIAGGDFSLILADLRLPDGDGVELLEWMNGQDYHFPYIIMTCYGQIANAVKAIKLGAVDYLCKPLEPENLYSVISEALQLNVHYPDSRSTAYYYQGKSKPVQECQRMVSMVAPTEMTVLICGASGTGKEYIAHSIHTSSDRADKPFIAVDCGAIPSELAASEFFGHVKGAFTGAMENANGMLLEANGGTLFLDEIGNLGHKVQMLLLRALQEKKFRPVGGKKDISVDVRIIAATNEILESAVREERFREDLFHRINEFTIHVPSLSECQEDIVPLAEFFLNIACRKLKKQVSGFDRLAEIELRAYPWPGNIREMQHLINRATLLAQGTQITPQDLNLHIHPAETPETDGDNREKELILHLLRATGGNRTKVAMLLSISRSTLYEKMRKYSIKE